jgi:hypothetical protein
MNIAKSAEKSVTMGRKPNVPLLTWNRGAGNMSHREPQGLAVDAFHDHGRKSDGANLDAPEL